jgi:hypothetical protein
VNDGQIETTADPYVLFCWFVSLKDLRLWNRAQVTENLVFNEMYFVLMQMSRGKRG